MSETRRRLESILVVDCGTTTTKAALLDFIAGEYRLATYAEAPSTAYKPWEDISAGAVSAIQRVEAISGRALLDEQDQPITPERGDGSGIDRLLIVSSAARPLGVLLVGLIHDVSLASARRAALSTYARIVGVMAAERRSTEQSAIGRYLGGSLSGAARADGFAIDAVEAQSIDVILMAGGTDGGASEEVLAMARDSLRAALYPLGSSAPRVLYAGNAELSDQVVALLEDVTSVQTVDNVRPTLDVEDIGPAHSELDVLFYERHMRTLAGIRRLRMWSPSIILPTARAADYAVRHLARSDENGRAVLGVDVGSSSVTVNVAQGEQARTTIRTDLGLGYGLFGLLEQVEMGDILRWLPFEMDESEARDRLLNKALSPHTIPQTWQDLMLEQAAARELLRLTLADALPEGTSQPGVKALSAWGSIIASGGVLAHVPHPGQAALILLDALQPVGMSNLYLDRANLLAALGTVANVEPLATVQMLSGDALDPVGTVVVPRGRARWGDTVLTVRSAAERDNVYLKVGYGDLGIVSLTTNEPEPKLEVVPARGFDVGNGRGKSVQVPYLAGSLGLIVDARGRPLPFDDDLQVQRERVGNWLYQMTGERGA
jgi:hypothetical protein